MQALFHSVQDVVLASASPRRQLFLQELGLTYSVVRPQGMEPRHEAGEAPAAYARRAASAKARTVAQACHALADKTRGPVVLAADTVVALGEVVLGKPQDVADALRMLNLLAGRGHEVITAVSLMFADGRERLFHDTAEVFFHPWPQHVLQTYAACGEPMDKAGAYAVQGQGAFLVRSINGSWSTVVGLPVTQVVAALLEEGSIGVGVAEAGRKCFCAVADSQADTIVEA